MKIKKYLLGVFVVATLMVGSICVSQLTNLSAQKKIQRLEGIVIVLDAGHGGVDDGAQSGKIKEDAINLKITNILKKLLEEAGAKVILTRDGDYDLAQVGSAKRKKEDMKKRVAIMNQSDVDLFLSIHLNAYPNPNVQGAVTFYQKDNEVSRALATIIQNRLKTLTGSHMSMKVGDYYVLNNTTNTGALVECGFLSNEHDRSLLVQDTYQEKIAKTLYESVCEYFSFLM